MSPVDLNELASFVAVVQSGSFAAASRRMGVPANTLSRRVQNLESSLGVKLVQRSTRQLAVTNPGRQLFERCESATSAIALAGREIAEHMKQAAGTIRVAAPVDFFDTFDPAWIQEFLAVHSQLRLEFVLDDEHMNLIADRIDVAIRRGHLVSSRLIARRIGPNHEVLVAAPSYVHQHGEPASVAELASHQCITLPHPDGRNRWTLLDAVGSQEVAVQGRVAADNIQALRRAALAGLGIALLPAVLAAEDLAQGRLQRLLPEFRCDGGGLFAVFVGGHIPLAASLFATFVADKLAPIWPEPRAVPRQIACLNGY